MRTDVARDLYLISFLMDTIGFLALVWELRSVAQQESRRRYREAHPDLDPARVDAVEERALDNRLRRGAAVGVALVLGAVFGLAANLIALR